MDGGLLRKLAGTPTVMVNSLHSQAVARLARGVTVEAVADDGLVEAFQVDGAKSFALAVQWHPEWKVTQNNFSKAIFEAFGDACRDYAKNR
jgi:putative glutamine amidotransferase